MDAENMTRSIMSLKKNYTITVFTSTGNRLVCSQEKTVSTSGHVHHTIIIETIII